MKPKILFVHENEREIKDGLWAALELLKEDFEIEKVNIDEPIEFTSGGSDIVIGWGAFGSRVDALVSSLPAFRFLCIGGTAGVPQTIHHYTGVFYETEWDYHNRLKQTHHENLIHAFGVNTDIFNQNQRPSWGAIDYLTVGALSLWKRQLLLSNKEGVRLAVGDIQKNNMSESMAIAVGLIERGCGVLPQVDERVLAKLYRESHVVYLPAELHGGGERALLEARSCGCEVEVEGDNPKLQELTTSPIWDHHYYAAQLKKGILNVL